MSLSTLHAAVDLLMTHRNSRVRLDFTGGEPLLRFDLLQEAMRYAAERAKLIGKSLSFYMVTNAIAMTDRVAEALSRHDIYVNLSLDGDARSNNLHRLPHRSGNLDAYAAARKGIQIALKAGLSHCAVLVVSPDTAGNLFDNFTHHLDLGLRAVEINYAIGSFWSDEQELVLFEQLDRIRLRYGAALSRGEIRLGNLSGRLEPAALNSELMVDCDGSIHHLSEWLFETTPAEGKPIERFGSVHEKRDINEFYWSRFRSYSTMLTLYKDNLGIRRVLLNNIRLGERVGHYFSAMKEKLNAPAPIFV